jgi:cysteine desulfurase
MYSHPFNNDYTVDTKFGKAKYVNLDNAATSPPFISVEEGVTAFLKTYGSVHRGSGEKSKISTDLYEKSREIIKDFAGANASDYVLFTNNTTGAMNILSHFFSFLEGKVAVSAIEHSTSWLPWIKAEGEHALGAKQMKLEDIPFANDKIQEEGNKQVLIYRLNECGEFDLSDIDNLLSKNKVKALVLTASSNITGYCPPIKEIGEIVHKHGVYYIVDACQYLQHHKIDMQALGIDFLCASGHKFYAPYGGGFLIGPKIFFDTFLPYQIGGGNLPYITSEGRFLRNKNQLAHDPGTPNAVGTIAMALALQQIKSIGIDNIEAYEKQLAEYAFHQLSAIKGVKLFVSKEQLSTVLPFILTGKSTKEVAEMLNDDYGIGVRYGNFCVYHIIRDMLGITKDEEAKIVSEIENGNAENIPGVLRASLSICNTKEDIDRLIFALKELTC